MFNQKNNQNPECSIVFENIIDKARYVLFSNPVKREDIEPKNINDIIFSKPEFIISDKEYISERIKTDRMSVLKVLLKNRGTGYTISELCSIVRFFDKSTTEKRIMRKIILSTPDIKSIKLICSPDPESGELISGTFYYIEQINMSALWEIWRRWNMKNEFIPDEPYLFVSNSKRTDEEADKQIEAYKKKLLSEIKRKGLFKPWMAEPDTSVSDLEAVLEDAE